MRRLSAKLVALYLAVGCLEAPAAAEDATALSARFSAAVEAKRQELIDIRRDIHRHPEIAGEEERTAGVVAARLEALGFEVRRNIGGHGVVGYLEGAKPGPVVAFRADMDAVRSADPDPVDFRSERPGIRHICGHDIHTTIGLAVAEGFASIKDDAAGSLLLVFQPAEESAKGARAMVAEGALASPKPDVIFGFHTAPYEVGQLGTAKGAMMAARDALRATLKGDAAKEAAQELARRLSALGTVESGLESQPLASDFVFAEVRTPPADDARSASVRGTFTMTTDGARKKVRAGADDGVATVERDFPGVGIEASYEAKWIPGVTNDAATVDRAAESIRAELGDGALTLIETIPPAFSEDFGHMQEIAPSAFFFLGVSNEAKGWVGMPHSPGYVADEEAIFIGARVMGRIIADYMTP